MDRNSSIRRLIRTYDSADVPATARPERFAYTDASELEWVVKPPAPQQHQAAPAQIAQRHNPGRIAASGL